jgi:hypothetical protein
MERSLSGVAENDGLTSSISGRKQMETRTDRQRPTHQLAMILQTDADGPVTATWHFDVFHWVFWRHPADTGRDI